MTDNQIVGDVPVVGDPLATAQAEPGSLVAGLGEDKVVAVYNPLSVNFQVQYTRSRVGAPQLSPNEVFAREKAGVDVSKTNNPMHHQIQFHILKAGQTENLPGDIAQIAVRKLVTYILQNRTEKGRPKMVASPSARREVEEEVVLKITDASDFFNRPAIPTAQEYTTKQIEDLNPKVEPKLEVSTNVPDPAPGQGVTYSNEPAKATN